MAPYGHIYTNSKDFIGIRYIIQYDQFFIQCYLALYRHHIWIYLRYMPIIYQMNIGLFRSRGIYLKMLYMHFCLICPYFAFYTYIIFSTYSLFHLWLTFSMLTCCLEALVFSSVFLSTFPTIESRWSLCFLPLPNHDTLVLHAGPFFRGTIVLF